MSDPDQHILRLQKILHALNCYAGIETGKMDKHTQDAIKKYKTLHYPNVELKDNAVFTAARNTLSGKITGWLYQDKEMPSDQLVRLQNALELLDYPVGLKNGIVSPEIGNAIFAYCRKYPEVKPRGTAALCMEQARQYNIAHAVAALGATAHTAMILPHIQHASRDFGLHPVVVIDPGHGSYDSKVHFDRGAEVNGVKEYAVNMGIAN